MHEHLNRLETRHPTLVERRRNLFETCQRRVLLLVEDLPSDQLLGEGLELRGLVDLVAMTSKRGHNLKRLAAVAFDFLAIVRDECHLSRVHRQDLAETLGSHGDCFSWKAIFYVLFDDCQPIYSVERFLVADERVLILAIKSGSFIVTFGRILMLHGVVEVRLRDAIVPNHLSFDIGLGEAHFAVTEAGVGLVGAQERQLDRLLYRLRLPEHSRLRLLLVPIVRDCIG